jgi:hypothetical protein
MADATQDQAVLTQTELETELADLKAIVDSMNETWREDHVRSGPLRLTDPSASYRETDDDRATRQASEAAAGQARLTRRHQLENDHARAKAICERLTGVKVKLTVKATAHRTRWVGSGARVLGGHDEQYDVPVGIMFVDVDLTFSFDQRPLQLMSRGPFRVVTSCDYEGECVTFDPYGSDVMMKVL